MCEKELAKILKEIEEIKETLDFLIEDYFKRNPPEEE